MLLAIGWASAGKRSTSTATTSAAAPASSDVVVMEVIDGDTVVVRRSTGEDVRVRLLGIDVPESSPPPECWAAESTAFARQSLLGRPVRLVPDPTQDTVDQYGRTLAYLVLPDGTDFSVAAAAAGAARSASHDGPVARHAQITAAEDQAKTAARGVWSSGCTAQPPPAAPVAQAAPAQPTAATDPSTPHRPTPAPRVQRAPVRAPGPVEEHSPAAAGPSSDCDPHYSGCVPIASDVDCKGGSGNGPAYVAGPVRVTGDDIYDLDRDKDGQACE